MNGTEVEQVSVDYVPERVDLDDGLDGEFREEFKKIFEKFSFQYPLGSLESASKMKKEADLSNSEDEEQQDNRQKEKGLSKKRKKNGRRMKIAEVKRYCLRPDVVEVWDATAADCRPQVAGFSEGMPKYCSCAKALVSEEKILAG